MCYRKPLQSSSWLRRGCQAVSSEQAAVISAEIWMDFPVIIKQLRKGSRGAFRLVVQPSSVRALLFLQKTTRAGK